MEKIKPQFFIIPCISLALMGLSKFFIVYGMQWYMSLQMSEYCLPVWLLSSAWDVGVFSITFSAMRLWRHIRISGGHMILVTFFCVLGWLSVDWPYRTFYLQVFNFGTLAQLALIVILCGCLFIGTLPVSRLAAFLIIPYGVFVALVLYNTYFLFLLNAATGLFRYL